MLLLRFVFVKQPYAMFHNNVPQNANNVPQSVQGSVHLLQLLQRSLQGAPVRVEWISKKPKFGLQQMGNAPKISRRDFFWGNAIASPWWRA
jgi:hypothetical protein